MKMNKIIIISAAILIAIGGAYAFYEKSATASPKLATSPQEQSKKDDGHEHPDGAKPEAESDSHSENDDNHGHTDSVQPEANDHEHSGDEDGHAHPTAGKPEAKSDGHPEEDPGHEHEESEGVKISEAGRKNAGLTIEKSGPASIQGTVLLTGRVALNQNKTALVRARFPGVIRSVKVSQGENVASGAVLATVESNESLQTYSITSPIAGTILTRGASIGDTAAEEPIFTVADLSELWVEVHVFAQDAGKIRAGQKLTITSSECEQKQEAEISALLPVTETSSQTLLARANIKNLDAHWHPGMSITAEAVISSKNADVAVKTPALQRVGNQTVVFVKEGDEFRSRPVEIGLSDDDWTEITKGLEPGEEYVSTGSFTVKAELSKSEAEHAH